MYDGSFLCCIPPFVVGPHVSLGSIVAEAIATRNAARKNNNISNPKMFKEFQADTKNSY